ncbi:MAG: hypothetical protein JWM41_1328 [Gemmatimonadetes bacterium]|nr:hypothetical protein [Gemmatimonadota bacterium]
MRLTSLSLALLAATAPLGAQQALPIRLIATPDAASKQTLGLVAAVRQLPNGSVLVNDAAKRQLLMFDRSLATATVIADSTSGGANSYGPAAGAIIGYAADSTLFVDPRDLSMFVIDPAGNIARVAAVPRSQDAGMLGSNTVGSPAFDGKGRLVYRAGLGFRMPPMTAKGPAAAPEFPDSSAIVRVDLVSRKLDTAGFYKIAKQKMTMTQNEGRMSITTEINPMPIVDEWAVLANGSIAVVRGRDYHVDLITADGNVAAAAKMPFEWQRLTDEDKVAVIDSAKAAMERARTAAQNGGGAPGEAGARSVVMNFSMGGDGPARSTTMSAGALPPLSFISPSELPDYRPAFTLGAAKADLDGNLWLRTTFTRAGAVAAGPIYDVIDSKGELVDRVQVPAGRTIVGFGKGGVVYMMARDDKGAWIERTHK